MLWGGGLCVGNSWKNGASWKSSAAVSLLLAARVYFSAAMKEGYAGRM